MSHTIIALRLEGTAGFFTVSMPLAIDASVASTTTGKIIKAKFQTALGGEFVEA